MSNKIDTHQLMDNVVATLRTCYDPEIPVNIYDLGLIYDIKVNEAGEVEVIMTLTSPACPVAELLPAQVQAQLNETALVSNARVLVTWEPPWDPSLMNEEAKLELGLF